MKDDKRQIILAKARALYITTGITRNITEALKMYLRDVAGPDEQIEIFITTPELHQLREILKLNRPECEECGDLLDLEPYARDTSGTVHATAWKCRKCGIILYSETTTREWLEILRDEAIANR